MSATTANWLADIITTHTKTLAADLAQALSFSPDGEADRQPNGARHYFTALAQTIAAGDMAPLRRYLEQFVPRRLQAGGQGGDYIQLINHAEDLIEALITREATQPDQGTDAQRLIRSMGRNARLIVSEVNLQLLVDPAHYSASPTWLPIRMSTPPAA